MLRAKFNQKTRRLEPVGLMMKKRIRTKYSFVIGKTSSQTFEQFNRHITRLDSRAATMELARELEEMSSIAPPIEAAFDASDYVAFCDLFGSHV